MPIERNKLEELIKETFPDADIEIIDLAGDNDHWRVIIAAAEFEGKTRIQQHKMVQAAIAGHDIHALAIKTIVPGL